MSFYDISAKTRKKLNKAAYVRFRRSSSMQQKKTTMRIGFLTAVEALLLFMFFVIL